MLKSIVKTVCGVIGFCILFVFVINAYMCLSTQSQINKELDHVDCILVLGAGVRGNNPSPMLSDRLDYAIQLYNQKKHLKSL